MKRTTISDTSLIGPEVEIGEGCVIGDFTVIRGKVVIGPNSVIEDFCSIGTLGANQKLQIGENSVIRSHTVIYGGSEFGSGLQTGNRVSIRSGTKIGKNVSVGTGSDIQGLCEIGDYARLHSNVHICQHSTVGRFSWLFPGVILTNDPRPPSEDILGPKIGDFCVVTVNSVVMPGVILGDACVVFPSTVVSKDYPAESIIFNKSKVMTINSDAYRSDGSHNPYPWPVRFGENFFQEEVMEQLHKLWGLYQESKKDLTS